MTRSLGEVLADAHETQSLLHAQRRRLGDIIATAQAHSDWVTVTIMRTELDETERILELVYDIVRYLDQQRAGSPQQG